MSVIAIESIVQNHLNLLIMSTGISSTHSECCWIMRTTFSLLNADLSVMVGQVNTVLSIPMGSYSSSNSHIYDQSIYSTGKNNAICLGMFAKYFNFIYFIYVLTMREELLCNCRLIIMFLLCNCVLQVYKFDMSNCCIFHHKTIKCTESFVFY